MSLWDGVWNAVKSGGELVGQGIGKGWDFLSSQNIDYQALLQTGGSVIKESTRPDAPRIQSYNPEPIKERKLTDFAPYTDVMDKRQANVALRMLSGEIPTEVSDQIRMTAGEKAIQYGRGDSEQRASNVTARDLGLSQLDIMQQGMAYSSELRNRARQDMNDKYQLDVVERNMAFDQWASQTQLQMDNYRSRVAGHDSYANDLLGGVNMFFENKEVKDTQKSIEQQIQAAINSYESTEEQISINTDSDLSGNFDLSDLPTNN